MNLDLTVYYKGMHSDTSAMVVIENKTFNKYIVKSSIRWNISVQTQKCVIMRW